MYFFLNIYEFIVISWRKQYNKQIRYSYMGQNKWGPQSPLIRFPSYFCEAISSFLFPCSSFIRFTLMWKFLCGQFEPENISLCWRLIIPPSLRQTLMNVTFYGRIIRGNLAIKCHCFVCLLFLCEFFSSEFSQVTACASQIVLSDENSKAINYYYYMLLVFPIIQVWHVDLPLEYKDVWSWTQSIYFKAFFHS